MNVVLFVGCALMVLAIGIAIVSWGKQEFRRRFSRG